MFGDNIILSFNNKFTKNNKMNILIIEFEQKTYLDTSYYSSHVLECENKHNIKLIRDQFKVQFDDDDLKDDCFN